MTKEEWEQQGKKYDENIHRLTNDNINYELRQYMCELIMNHVFSRSDENIPFYCEYLCKISNLEIKLRNIQKENYFSKFKKEIITEWF